MDGHGIPVAGEGGRVTFDSAPVGFAEPFLPPATASSELAIHGLIHWLHDFGHDLAHREDQWTHRWIGQVTAEGGLQAAANFGFSFDPSFERAIIHAVRVCRDGLWRDAADPAALQVLQREPNLERACIDGRLTVHLVIPDIRVGDIVETCYSIRGANPALRGIFSAAFALQWGIPAALRRYRLRAPLARKFNIRVKGDPPAIEERIIGDTVERTWTLEPATVFQFEPDTPSWWIGYTHLAVADQMSWADVADIHRAYYAPPNHLPHELEVEAARIERTVSTLAERVRLALDLVQSQIRYHALAIGEGGFVPRPIEEVWRSRFGDCKDASRLFVALAKRLGAEAEPALVSGLSGPSLGDWPPSVRAFDHCLARVEVEGVVYWLDPTYGRQGGRLDRLFQPRFGYALPLKPEAELEAMGEHPVHPVIEGKEDWDFGAFAGGPAEVYSTVKLGSWRADDLRRELANNGNDAVARRFAEAFEKAYGELSVVESTVFEDDLEENIITIKDKYRVLRPWKTAPGHTDIGVFNTVDEIVGPHLTLQETARRSAPVALGTPRRARWERDLNLPTAAAKVEWDREWSAAGVRYLHRCETLHERRHRQTQEIEFTRSYVEAHEAMEIYDLCRSARASNGYTQQCLIQQRRSSASSGQSHPFNFVAAALKWAFLVLFIMMIISSWLGSRRHSTFQSQAPVVTVVPSTTPWGKP